MSTCKTCRFWYPAGDPDIKHDWAPGICRRRSPQVDPSNSNKWPTTYTLEWCGEHEEKPVPEPVMVPEGFDPRPGALNRYCPPGKPTDPAWWR